MRTEILDHVCRILGREATRTLSARELYQRTAAALAIDIPYNRFVEILSARPDRVTVIADRTRLGEHWSAHDRRRYAAALERAHLPRGAVVMLVEQPFAGDHAPPAHPGPPEPLGALLADVHAALVELMRANDAASLAGPLDDAVTELDELRDACTAALRRVRQ